MGVEVVAGTSSNIYRRARTEAQRNKVRMVCSVCDRVVEVFTYNPVMQAWLPREPKYDPPRPTGMVWPSDDDRVRGLRTAGLHLFRCHQRCGRVEPVRIDVIVLCCSAAVANGTHRFDL